MSRIQETGHKFWISLAALLLLFAALRLPLLDVPLERDEGEYATMGLGILRGTPPYAEAYTMKFPGTAAAYALIFSCLGASARAVHLGLLLVNAASILLVALLGRRLVGGSGGLFAAAAFGAFTLGTGMFGFWLSAEHFAAFFLLGGACVCNLSHPPRRTALLSGAFLLGASVLFKQHAALPTAVWLLAEIMPELRQADTPSRLRRTVFVAGCILAFASPLLLTCGIMAGCGVFERFRFWTLEYASQYVSAVPFALGWEYFKIGVGNVFRDAPLLWIMALAGLVIHLGRRSAALPAGVSRWILVAPAAAAMVAAGLGLMFRGQYFILLAPFAALLAGVAWETIQQWLLRLGKSRVASSAGWFAGLLLALLLFGGPILHPWLLGREKNPVEICREVYGLNPFPEYVLVADYFRDHSRPDERVAVVGSEPGIYFLADRRPATPYLYVYEMMKSHPYAKRMQQEGIAALEAARPRCMVLVNVPTSWGRNARSDPAFADWIEKYAREHYELDGVVDLISETETVVRWGAAARDYRPQSHHLLILNRRN